MIRIFLFIILGISIITLVYFLTKTYPQGIEMTTKPANTKATIFPHTCIDTMKVSRDRARELINSPQAASIIKQHIDTIASLGATCVAIGTPYDEEFQPYMKMWITEARKAGLTVWFRGNWSSWEGWFSYPKNMTPEQHVQKTAEFIQNHPDLFLDGDIFSANVEPENGGPFHPFNSQEKRIGLQKYLQAEQIAVKNAFSSINKKVTTNWISLSGGVARGMLDQQTVDALDGIVTLDHYVASPEGMREYIDLFHEPFGATIVFGEFGAPIPDINGVMDEKEQATFMDSVLWELFLERKKIGGVNYWTLTESSTALLDNNNVKREVAAVLRKYYVPGEVIIQVRDNHGRPLENVIITVRDNDAIERTDKAGKASVIMPQGTYTLTMTTTKGKTLKTPLTITGNEVVSMQATFGN